MNIIKNYLTKNRCYQQNVKRTPIGIQIHTIGTGQGTAQSVAEYWNQSAVSACVTYCVDCDTAGKVLQFLPENVRSWADAGFGNSNLITIEICESDYIKYTSGASYKVLNDAKFKEDILRGYNTAVLLCADICNRYSWDPTTKLTNGLYLISSHDEGRRAGVSSAHVDPTHIWSKIEKTMDIFRKEVKAAMGKTVEDTINIKGTAIGDSNVEAVSKVVYGEAGVIKSYDALVAVAQCIKDMMETGGYGNTITQVLENNFSAYGSKETSDDARQAVYDVFINGVRRFKDAKILQFRSFTNYSDGNGNMDQKKCAAILKKYEYLGKDARDNKWGHLYFGYKIASATTVPAEKIQKSAATWAIAIAKDDTHGYNNAAKKRGGNPDYACSSFVNEAYRQAGLDLPKSATVYTSKMKSIYTEAGFEVITDEVNLKTGSGLKTGDIVLTPGKHVEIYVGDGKLAGARGNAQALKAENGKPGDQTGNEIAVSAYYNFPWTVVLRYTRKKEAATTVPAKQYRVQAGAFSKKKNANTLIAKLKNKGFDAILKQEKENYIVQTGVFKDKARAQALAEQMQTKGFDAIVKEM